MSSSLVYRIEELSIGREWHALQSQSLFPTRFLQSMGRRETTGMDPSVRSPHTSAPCDRPGATIGCMVSCGLWFKCRRGWDKEGCLLKREIMSNAWEWFLASFIEWRRLWLIYVLRWKRCMYDFLCD